MTENINTKPECLFCKSPNTQEWIRKTNDAGEFPIHKCLNCGSGFVWPRPSDEVLAEIYSSEEYAPPGLDSMLEDEDKYVPSGMQDAKRIIGKLLKLTDDRTFLDIGAGCGLFAKEAMDSGFEVGASEPSPGGREAFYELCGFLPEDRFLDEAYAEENMEKYGVVLLSQVLEHLKDPADIARLIYKILKPGGIAMIAIPHFGSLVSKIQGENDMYLIPPVHLNFFSRQGLGALFDRSGYSTVTIDTVNKINLQFFNRGPLKKFPRAITELGGWGMHVALKPVEFVNRGMVLNGYFRKH